MLWIWAQSGYTKGGQYHYTVDPLCDCFGLACFANKNKTCPLSCSWFQTSQTGGQWYSDTSPFSIPWPSLSVRSFCDEEKKSFIKFSTGEKTALFCLAQHDWKLDVALDNYFASPEVYFREPKAVVDKKKLESAYAKYRGNGIGANPLGVQYYKNFFGGP